MMSLNILDLESPWPAPRICGGFEGSDYDSDDTYEDFDTDDEYDYDDEDDDDDDEEEFEDDDFDDVEVDYGGADDDF